MRAFSSTLAAALAVSAFPSAALADSGLLTPAGQAQLEAWLGHGALHFTSLYTFTPGSQASSFHAAADGRGPTFSLMQVSHDGQQWLVGGYDPQSWDSLEHWHETPDDADRVAFVFNLTDSKVWHQVPSSYILPSQGQKQTWNSASQGPAFGEGGDLWVQGDTNIVYSVLFTYGDPATEQGRSLIDGSMRGATLPTIFQLDAMEVFAVAAVPEPSTYAMLGAGLCVSALALRRRRRSPVV